MIIPFLTPFGALWQRLIWGSGVLLAFAGACIMIIGYEEGKCNVPPVGIILFIIGMPMILIGLIIAIQKLDGFEYNWRGEATRHYWSW